MKKFDVNINLSHYYHIKSVEARSQIEAEEIALDILDNSDPETYMTSTDYNYVEAIEVKNTKGDNK